MRASSTRRSTASVARDRSRRAAYVGDRLHTDAVGAARAGLVGVWLNRHGVPPTDDEAAEASAAGVIEIRGLDELVAQLVPRFAPPS